MDGLGVAFTGVDIDAAERIEEQTLSEYDWDVLYVCGELAVLCFGGDLVSMGYSKEREVSLLLMAFIGASWVVVQGDSIVTSGENNPCPPLVVH